MYKRIVLASLVLVLALGLIAGIYVTPSLAQGEDSVTITTYYPSPYGSYNELQTNRLAVGDTNGLGTLDAADQPPQNGQIYTARSVIFKPHTNLAAIQGLPDPKIGELVYASGDDKWYYNNTGTSSGWVAQGGGSGIKSVQHKWLFQTLTIATVSYTTVDIALDTPLTTTKAEVKVWLILPSNILPDNIPYAPCLTSTNNLRVYVANVSSGNITSAQAIITYEIIEYE